MFSWFCGKGFPTDDQHFNAAIAPHTELNVVSALDGKETTYQFNFARFWELPGSDAFHWSRWRVSLVLLTWIYSCRSRETVNFTFPLKTNMISISIYRVTNFPFFSSCLVVPSSPAYDVFLSHLIWYAMTCSSNECFILGATWIFSN